MTGLELNRALHSKKRVYGTLIVSPSPHYPDAVKAAGLDFAFLDTEHIALDRMQLSWMCRTYRAMHLAPIVRIAEPDPILACMALDGGAEGVIAPYIETPEQVRALYGAVKLRPLKGRRLEHAVHDRERLEPRLSKYLADRNAGNVLILNIESVPALEALDDILSVPGVDAVQVGPHDLSCSLGIPEDYHHPKFEEAIRHIVETSMKHKVGVGVHFFWEDLEQEMKFIRWGANLVVHFADIILFKQTLTRDIARYREAFGDKQTGAADDIPAI